MGSASLWLFFDHYYLMRVHFLFQEKPNYRKPDNPLSGFFATRRVADAYSFIVMMGFARGCGSPKGAE